MDWKKLFDTTDELPLDRFPSGISNTAIFRTMGFIGDSLSSGEFESRDAVGTTNWHDCYEYSWGQYIARKNGLRAYNFSRGGMTAKEYWESFANTSRFWRPELACQAYVIALGVNDIINCDFELGVVEDYRRDRPTFAGYLGKIIARLKTIQPDAKFFFLSMPKDIDGKDDSRAAHAALLYDMAEHFGNSYVIDLYKYGPVQDEDYRHRFYLYGHLNASGYVLTANMVDAYIDYLIRKHPDDFRYVPYIGTELK